MLARLFCALLVPVLGGCYSYQLSSIRELQAHRSPAVRLTTYGGQTIETTVQRVDYPLVIGSGKQHDLRLFKSVEVKKLDRPVTALAAIASMAAVALVASILIVSSNM